MKMDPRLKILIAEVRKYHVPVSRGHTYTGLEITSYCHGCKGLEYDCPVLKVVDELEKEYGHDESS